MTMQRISRFLAKWRCFGQFYFFFDVGSIWTKHWKTCTKSLIACLLWGLSQFVVRVGGLVIDKSIVYMMQICTHALTQFVQICPKLSKVWTMDKYTIFSMRVNKNWILIVLDNWTILDKFGQFYFFTKMIIYFYLISMQYNVPTLCIQNMKANVSIFT